MGLELTKKKFQRALREIEKDALEQLRNPRVYCFHPEDLKKLRKAGFFKEFKTSDR